MNSSDLKKYEIEVLTAIASDLAPQSFEKVDEKDVKNYFSKTQFDGVFLNGKNLIIVEIALGGGVDKLKAGPARKMKTDVLKLISSDLFLKDSSFVVQKRILYVRKGIKSKLDTGWLSEIISHSNNKIEIKEYDFGSSEEEIQKIRDSSIYERMDDSIYPESED